MRKEIPGGDSKRVKSEGDRNSIRKVGRYCDAAHSRGEMWGMNVVRLGIESKDKSSSAVGTG